MAIEISFKIEGKMQTFTKDKIYFRDNIRAVKHQILQSRYYENPLADSEKFEEMQNDFCQMIADIFGNDFSGEQLRDGFPLSERQKLEDVYILALGGELEKKENKDEKK